MVNQQSRIIKSSRNMVFGVGNQILNLILQFITRTVFINVLGAEYLGINGLFTNILTLLSLADLGLNTAMVYSFYKPLAVDDKTKLSALITFYKKIYNTIAIIITIIGCSFIPFLGSIVNTESEIPHLQIYYILFLLNTVMSYLFVYRASIIRADQKAYIISKYRMVTFIVMNILQIVFLLQTHNYIVYLLIQILCNLVNNIAITRKANKLYPFIKEKEELAQEEKKFIIDNIKSVFLYKFSSVLLNGTDNIIISKMIGTIWVGLYSNYQMIISAISSFISIGFTSMYASIGNLVATAKEEKRKEVFNTISLLGFFISAFTTCCLTVLINDFIQLWIGEEYILQIEIVIAILLNHYLACVLQPVWSFREATGIFKKTKYVMVVCAILNIILSIILGIYFGVAGILFASAISRLTTYFWYEPVILFRDYFKSSARSYYWKQLKNAILTIICISITFMITSLIKNVGIIEWIGKALIASIVTSVIYYLLYRKTNEFQYIYNNVFIKMLNKVRRK